MHCHLAGSTVFQVLITEKHGVSFLEELTITLIKLYNSCTNTGSDNYKHKKCHNSQFFRIKQSSYHRSLSVLIT